MIRKCLISVAALTSIMFSQTWQSTKVYYQNNRLVYTADAEQNKISDFSYSGYKRNEDSIPFIPVVKTISPVSGDNTAHIQTAIDQVGKMALNASGFRGALLLLPGKYNVDGSLFLKYSGVILRGSGDGADSVTNTIIYGRGNEPAQRTILTVGGGSNTLWRDSVSGTKTVITSALVPVGDRVFTVANATPYKVGDNIIIYHPCTEAWLQSVNYGGTNGSNPWTVNEQPIMFNRRITAKQGNVITIDAPVYTTLNSAVSTSYIYKYSRNGIITQTGVENLRIDIETAGGTDEQHAWNALDMAQIEDSWVRNSTFLHFGLSGIQTFTATRLTIENCNALDPVSIIEGGKRYNFNCYAASQLILFKNCKAVNGRHHFVSNGHSLTSGIVFYRCRSERTNSSSEGHRRWTQGMLYDNYVDTLPVIGNYVLALLNRGDYGTGHGWAAVHSVAWNCRVNNRDLIVQKPPTGQNYAIGCFGRTIAGTTPPAPFVQPEGFIEGKNTAGLYPVSLFEAQLAERLAEMSTSQNSQVFIEKTPIIIDCFPNPFNPQVTVKVKVNEKIPVKVEIFDSLGQPVSELFNGIVDQSGAEFSWKPGKGMASGAYFISAQSGTHFIAKKILFVK